MGRLIFSATLLAGGLAISACSTDLMKPEWRANPTYYSENQPVVQRTDYVIDLETSGNGVSTMELARLADWFDSLQLRYGDRIAIDDPYASDGVREDVARLTAGYGLLMSHGAPITPGTVAPGYARVIVSRATAEVPGCPNWRQAELSGGAISTESNYGCATNSNLAAMVANPNDLVLGQEGAVSSDATTTVKAIKQYRDAPPSGAAGLDKVSTKGGN